MNKKDLTEADIGPVPGATTRASPFASKNSRARAEHASARTVDQGDTYSRCGLPDPYRWLEDDPSAKRLNALCDYAKFPSPSRKGDYNGLQNQSVLYIQKG